MLRAVFATWPRRRWVATVVSTPIVAAAFFTVSGTPTAQASKTWLLLVAIAAIIGSAVLASYVPASGRRPDLGCTPCAAMSAMTLVGAVIALNSYGPQLTGAALAIAVTLFGLTQRLSQTTACAVPN